MFDRIYEMLINSKKDDFHPGITSFDQYARWQEYYDFGVNTVMPDGVSYRGNGDPKHLSNEDREQLAAHIEQNVTSIADEYADVEFYYFFTPYSILWYMGLVENGSIFQRSEAEKYAIEMILKSNNIKLFSFNTEEDILTDINNYKDISHYGDWINSYILKCMSQNRCGITKENYEEYISDTLRFFLDFDYNVINEQIDYEDDSYASTLLSF